MKPHEASFARALEGLLAARHPQHAWTVSFREDDGTEPVRDAPTGPSLDQARALADDTDAVSDRDELAAARRPNDDGLKEAA